MDSVYIALVFILGLILGSFFNVCIYRIPREESIAFPPSHCSNCNKDLKAYDLIPVVSYLVLRGKCRNCGNKISIQYPIIEIITGIAYTMVYMKFGFSVEFFLCIVLVSVLIITSGIDINTKYIHQTISIIGIVSGGLFILYSYFSGGEVLTYILGGIIASGIIAIFAFLGGMGWGDVEVAFMCGLFLGISSSILMIFISIILGGIIGAVILTLNKKVRKEKATMPFAPFIAIGCFISLIYGEGLVRAFLNYYGIF